MNHLNTLFPILPAYIRLKTDISVSQQATTFHCTFTAEKASFQQSFFKTA
jgi:hypothetical protein